MMRELIVSSDTSILVYGAGEVGRRFAAAALRKGYPVLGFMDRGKAGSHCAGVPVFAPDADLSNLCDKKAVLICICLADGLQHLPVARQLHKLGYRHIAFLPMELPLAPERRDALTRNYNRILALENAEGLAIEDFSSLITPACDAASAVLMREGGRVTCFADVELVFSENKERWQGDKTKLHGADRFSDVNISGYNYYFSLFSYLSGDSATWEEYRAGFTRNMEGFSFNIPSRNRLYDLFCRELDRGLGFFIEAAPEARWTPQGYFNLVGGHHRTCFLVFKKHRLLPVKMSREDFDAWCNAPRLPPVTDFLREFPGYVLYSPIPHPALRSLPARRETHLDCVYSTLTAFLGTDELEGRTVIDLCDDDGHYARCCCRIKAESVRQYAPDAQKARIAKALNELLYCSRIEVAVGLPPEGETCSLLLAMDRALALDADARRKFMAMTGRMTTRQMVWESLADDFDDDREAICNLGGFRTCDIILHPVVDGVRRTVAVFGK